MRREQEKWKEGNSPSSVVFVFRWMEYSNDNENGRKTWKRRWMRVLTFRRVAQAPKIKLYDAVFDIPGHFRHENMSATPV